MNVLLNIDYDVKSHISKGVRFTSVGAKSIRGKVKKIGVAIPCRVRLYEKSTGQKLAEVATDIEGNYEFSKVEQIKCFIVAHDPANQFNAVIQDNVVPK
ncbi:carboxypeptidase regulatory-like domain-containing protein [Acinetobacter sp. SWBY1]|uniref:carboxypeptidase regulatory-like domain-containing protein n=1 Tax=Acinetobacter sp. SWBY1 TaxID=2079596 RepID=UPI001BC88A48|nr:carboxypeptidase regulatory-like domain-containing protein [Acinetobacter sp. SWBY1]